MDILKSLGIGQKSSYQKERDASPVLSAMFQRRQPTFEEIQEQERLNRASGVTFPRYQGTLRSGEKLRNIGGLTYVVPADAPVVERNIERRPQSYSSLDTLTGDAREQYIPGIQSQSNIGLFTQRDPNPTVLEEQNKSPTVLEEQNKNPTVLSPTEEQELLAMGERAEAAMEQSSEERPSAFGSITDSFVDRLREANNSTAIYDSLVSGAKRFDKGFQNVFDGIVNNVVNFDPAKEARDRLDQAIAQKEQYQDNLIKQQQQQLNSKILENSRQLTNNLIQEQIDKSKAKRATEDLMSLESQVQAANNQMDRTNYLLRESGLFGQGMGGPSYSNPMQPIMPGQQPFDPGLSINSMYENPEYYQAGVALSNASADPNSPLYDPQYANRPISYYNEPQYQREVKRLYK